MSESANRALFLVSEDFRKGDPAREAIENITRFLFERPSGELRHLTFGILLKAAKLSENDGETLHRAISYMLGERINLLSLEYEFIQDDFEYTLGPEEVDALLERGEFYDPRSGRSIEDFGPYIYVYFRPSQGSSH